jgi:hypothetical protein
MLSPATQHTLSSLSVDYELFAVRHESHPVAADVVFRCLDSLRAALVAFRAETERGTFPEDEPVEIKLSIEGNDVLNEIKEADGVLKEADGPEELKAGHEELKVGPVDAENPRDDGDAVPV